MAVWALLPVKNFAAAKTRLASHLCAEDRAKLAKAMYSDVLSAVCGSSRLDGVVIVTSDQVAQRHARRCGAAVVSDPRNGLNPALEAGRAYATDRGASAVLVVPSDIPAMCTSDIDTLVDTAAETGVGLIVPDHHQTGTNTLLVPQSAHLPFSFGPNSLMDHCRLAKARGVAMHVVQCPQISHDCDTPEDLQYLSTVRTGRHTEAVLNDITQRSDTRLRLVS